MRRMKRAAIVVASALVGAFLVPSPLYLIARMIWPDGEHSSGGEAMMWMRFALVYGGGAVFWGWLTWWYIARHIRRLDASGNAGG